MRIKKSIEIKCFDNFNDTNEIETEKFYNYSANSKLKNSLGVVNATFPLNSKSTTYSELKIKDSGITGVEGLAYFKQFFPKTNFTTHRLLIYGGDKKVYINQMLDDTFDLFWLYNLEFNSAPITLSYKKDDEDVIILSCVDQMKVWKTNYSPYTISGVPIITSMCMHENVLFCTIKHPAYKVWYATDLDAEKIGEINVNSGYINLDDELGYARKVVVYNEDVYIFRDYGISKINNFKNDLSVSQIYLSNTKIYSNTVCVSGNVILFMTKDGLYTFNGVKVNKLKVQFFNNFTFDIKNAVASSLGEKYYLALKINFDDDKKVLCEQDEYVNNAMLVIDTTNSTYQIIRGVDIKSLLPIKTDVFEKMLVVFNSAHKDIIGEVVNKSKCVDDNLPKFWSCKNLVDSPNTKLFTKLSVNSDEGVKFTLKHENKETNFTTYKKGTNEFMFKICCKDLQLEISSNNESANVNKVVFDYYEY